MKNVKWIPPLMATLFALPVFAQPLVLDDAGSAEVKAQVYENQLAETSGASTSMQTDDGAPAAEDTHAAGPVQGGADNAGKTDAALSMKESAAKPPVAASTAHPEKPTAQPEHRRVHVVRHAKKKTG